MKSLNLVNNMKTLPKSIVCHFIALLCLAPINSWASVMVNGSATVNYENSIFTSTPNDKVKEVALRLAKRQAWEKYTQSFTPSKLEIYRELESEIVESLDTYLLKVNVIDEKTDEENHRYSVTIRATINDARLETFFSDAAKKNKQKSERSNLFSYLFVAREQSSVTTFDNTKMKSQISQGGQSVTSGSNEKNADKVEYRLLSTGSIETAMNQALTTAGFEVVNYVDVVNECGGAEPKALRETFTISNEISREQRKNAINGAKTCDVTYFALGTLDVVMADTDPVSGNQRVFVSVKSQVWNIKSKLPKQVSSVGPVQYQGIGPNNLVAQNNALTAATENVAKEIINQLNAKGIN